MGRLIGTGDQLITKQKKIVLKIVLRFSTYNRKLVKNESFAHVTESKFNLWTILKTIFFIIIGPHSPVPSSKIEVVIF